MITHPVHYWALGMSRAAGSLFSTNICGDDIGQWTNDPTKVTCERCAAALRAGFGAPGTGPEITAPISHEAKVAVAEVLAVAPTSRTFADALVELKMRKLAKAVREACVDAVFVECKHGHDMVVDLEKLITEALK